MKLLFIKGTVPYCMYVYKFLMCTDFLCVCVSCRKLGVLEKKYLMMNQETLGFSSYVVINLLKLLNFSR